MSTDATATAYTELVAKIVEAVPDIIGQKCGNPVCSCNKWDSPHRCIILEDVLQAFHRKTKLVCPIVVDQYGGFWEQCYGGDELLAEDKKGWEFGKSLSDQSPECIAFLHSLLV